MKNLNKFELQKKGVKTKNIFINTYKKVNGHLWLKYRDGILSCEDPGDGSGDYADIVTCNLACSGCMDPIVTTTTTNATTIYSDGFKNVIKNEVSHPRNELLSVTNTPVSLSLLVVSILIYYCPGMY